MSEGKRDHYGRSAYEQLSGLRADLTQGLEDLTDLEITCESYHEHVDFLLAEIKIQNRQILRLESRLEGVDNHVIALERRIENLEAKK